MTEKLNEKVSPDNSVSQNREIKFRAYHQGEKRMYNVLRLGISNYKILLEGNGFEDIGEYSNDELIIMQYTGLKDKNGKDIYEGDIIKYDEDDSMNHWVSGETALVIGLPGRFTARMKPYDTGKYNNQNTLNEEFQDCIEILGNIYQNAELLSE